ncbi:GH39 family glycosyl hydrolase [Myxococcus stipitatus]|uniref:GH39 family glycosyl hydrolase n=1 Tax=Myxococcus stipitatus TaxID=83455 RepID=UPI0030CD131B
MTPHSCPVRPSPLRGLKPFIGGLCLALLSACGGAPQPTSESRSTGVTRAALATTLTIDTTSNAGSISPFSWGVAAPDKYLAHWPGNATLRQRIRDANVKIVRLGLTQWGKYNNSDVYPAHDTWNWATLDTLLNTVWDSGAEPLIVVCGFPGGVAHTLGAGNAITSADWAEYGHFMAGLVQRYNVDKALGPSKSVRYFEMWNEPSIEWDGKFTSMADYNTFFTTVAAAMRAKDPGIKLIGPADTHSGDLDKGPTESWVSNVAKNLEAHADYLSWHNYGPWANDTTRTDADRMAWTKPNYQDDVLKVKSGGLNGVLTGPSGKTFGAAITEFNVAQGDFAAFNPKYHSEFNATWTASALLNAMKGGVDLFTLYNLAENDKNHLGLLRNTDFSPYTPYFTLFLFGNYTGDRRLMTTGDTATLEALGSQDLATGTTFLTVVNKDTAGNTYDVTVSLVNHGVSSGTVKVRVVNAATTANPTSFTTLPFTGASFSYSVPPYHVVSFELAPAPGTAVLFKSGFESTDTQPTWLDTVEESQNVVAQTWASKVECSPRQETPRSGIATLMYSGKDTSAAVSYANSRVFDVHLPITAGTKLSYWIHPQQDNGRYVAVDFVCTDGTTLRDSGAVDSHGFSLHANAGHGGAIPLNTWTRIQSQVGQWLNGKTVDRILVSYDRPAATGDYRGYLDDLVITNGPLAP